MAKDKELMLSNEFLFFPTEQAKTMTLDLAYKYYHKSIFIGNNGPICFLLTYAAISSYLSNHWKLTG